jgi:hypothetical protein
VSSTLLNLFVLPSLYLRFGKSKSERLAAAAGASGASPHAAAAPPRLPAKV